MATSFSLHTPHLQALYRAAGANKPAAAEDETPLLGALGSTTTAVHRKTKPSNFVAEALTSAYNALIGRKQLRAHIKAAAAEAQAIFRTDPIMLGHIAKLKDAARLTKKGHNTRVKELAPHLQAIQEELLDLKAALTDVLSQSITAAPANATWVEAEKRELVQTPLLEHLPSLSLTNNPALLKGIKRVARGDSKTLAAALGKEIKKALHDLEGPEGVKTRISFALSGAQIRERMFLALANEMDPDVDLEALLAAVNAGYEQGISAKTQPEDLGEGKLPTSFEAAGKRYVISKDALKQGGMSSVGVYKCGDEEVVLKRTKPGDVNEASFNAMAHESLVQLAANAASDHTTKLIDVIRLPDGSLGMVMRRAHGDFEKKVMPQLDDNERSRRIAQLQGAGGHSIKSELTPGREKHCKDALRAVGDLHRKGITHGDLKGENFFMRSAPEAGELSVEVADFGTAQFGRMGPAPTVDCPNWRAPEVARAMLRAMKLKDRIETTLQTKLENRQRVFDKATGEALKDATAKLAEVKLEIANALKELAALPQIDRMAADSWSLGCILYQACTGLWPFERKDAGGIGQWAANEDEEEAFCLLNPQERYNYLFKNTKVPEHFRGAIMGLLNPNPAERMTPDQALASLEDMSSAFTPTATRPRARTTA